MVQRISHRRSSEIVVVNEVGPHASVRNTAEEQARIVKSAVDSLRPSRINKAVSGTHLFTTARERRKAVIRVMTGKAISEGDFWPED